MDKELKDKLNSLKEDTPVQKKKCTSCKKKKEAVVLPTLIDNEEYIPTPEDIRLAYIEMGNKDHIKRQSINNVYQYLFNEQFDWNCKSCANGQVRKLRNYIINVLKINVP